MCDPGMVTPTAVPVDYHGLLRHSRGLMIVDQVKQGMLSENYLRQFLPSPRRLSSEEIESNAKLEG
ncbi:hypothetical protein N7476_005152 [Penicillium atrosanguineum]|uniref:Uncharacterized protein n=1 Tax=Penicillium atrosanguineum TaxID=1132637 RepID=A0A9W9U7C7_9EURO|nr:hypothetical protein N7526_011475 [Penicillium atrosanguineum]KAJ5318732.1 hypothetical protein N7476_005152 [Penicillium atrosanguineum]